jgi:hypothetical protein
MMGIPALLESSSADQCAAKWRERSLQLRNDYYGERK